MSLAGPNTARERDRVSMIRIPIQVAAVCYRRGRSGIEFLLVRTSGGRWIFPKGGLEESLSNCEAAAREAKEEAGVMGVIEPRCFRVFKYWKGDTEQDVVFVEAYLLEVLETGTPEEEHRDPTWFRPRAARRAIGERRDAQTTTELACVIEAAVRMIAAGESQARRV